jgi:XRE family transcriptional regulator, regulator of sulfur utilization
MITCRDCFVAAVAALLAGAAVAWAQSPAKPVMHSTVFDWDKLKVDTINVGERRAVFDSPVATLDRLECHITTLNPGEQPHDPHQHPEEEMLFLKEGTMDIMQNGEHHRIGPGSVVFNASNEPHGYRNVGETKATYWILKWYSPKPAK